MCALWYHSAGHKTSDSSVHGSPSWICGNKFYWVRLLQSTAMSVYLEAGMMSQHQHERCLWLHAYDQTSDPLSLNHTYLILSQASFWFHCSEMMYQRITGGGICRCSMYQIILPTDWVPTAHFTVTCVSYAECLQHILQWRVCHVLSAYSTFCSDVCVIHWVPTAHFAVTCVSYTEYLRHILQWRVCHTLIACGTFCSDVCVIDWLPAAHFAVTCVSYTECLRHILQWRVCHTLSAYSTFCSDVCVIHWVPTAHFAVTCVSYTSYEWLVEFPCFTALPSMAMCS
jgi:translation initiation factor IF-1